MSLFDTQKREVVIQRIGHLYPDAAAQWGKMNCNQAVCHLADQIRGAMGELQWKDQNSFIKKTLVKWLAVYLIPVPKNVPTMPEADQQKDGTKPTDFENDRATLIAYIEKFAAAPNDFPWSPHAAFGRMSRDQWNRLTYKHLDHHLKQFGV
jgi:hypothetical protein